MSLLKCSVAAALCDDGRKDNDTPVQSQPHRDMGSRNEGSSVRTTEGLGSREADKAGRRLIDSQRFRGVEDKCESISKKSRYGKVFWHALLHIDSYLYLNPEIECVRMGGELMNTKYGPGGRLVKRGDIYYADLPDIEEGSVQAGKRPVLITQCNRLNKNSTTVVVAIITSRIKRPDDEAHVVLPMIKGLPKQSMVEAEQRKTISKSQLIEYRCTLDEVIMEQVTKALRLSEKPDRNNTYKRKAKRNCANSKVAQVQGIKKQVIMQKEGSSDGKR